MRRAAIRSIAPKAASRAFGEARASAIEATSSELNGVVDSGMLMTAEAYAEPRTRQAPAIGLSGIGERCCDALRRAGGSGSSAATMPSSGR